MPRGIQRPPLLLLLRVYSVWIDKIIYWVKIAGQELSISIARSPSRPPSLRPYLGRFIYFGRRCWPYIMLAPCWCYRSGSVDSMFTQWGRCCDMRCVCVSVCMYMCVCLFRLSFGRTSFAFGFVSARLANTNATTFTFCVCPLRRTPLWPYKYAKANEDLRNAWTIARRAIKGQGLTELCNT